MSTFKRGTGLMGATHPGQKVTTDNIEDLPPGSVIRNGDGSRIIHLHEGMWLHCSDHSHCYNGAEGMRRYLDDKSTLCHHP